MTQLPNPKLCPACGERGEVTDSRALTSVGAQRRHHVCKCGHKWNTYETVLDPRRVNEALDDAEIARLRLTVNTSTRAVVRKPR